MTTLEDLANAFIEGLESLDVAEYVDDMEEAKECLDSVVRAALSFQREAKNEILARESEELRNKIQPGTYYTDGFDSEYIRVIDVGTWYSGHRVRVRCEIVEIEEENNYYSLTHRDVMGESIVSEYKPVLETTFYEKREYVLNKLKTGPGQDYLKDTLKDMEERA